MEDKSIQLTDSVKKTNYQFKILYAIGIIFVVAGHAGANDIIFWNELMHCAGYYMGMFVFCSGYFYNSSYDSLPGKYIIKKAKHLLVPYILWNCFYGLLVFILSKFGFTIGLPIVWQKFTYLSILGLNQFDYNTSSWFVIPLFMAEVWNVLIRFILKKFEEKQKDLIVFVCGIITGFLGIYLAMRGYNYSGWLFATRFMYFVPFYVFGILYQRYIESRDNFSSFWYFTIIVGIMLTIILVIGHSPYYLIVDMKGFENPVFPYFVGLIGIAFWLRVSRILTPVIGKSKILNMIADDTYSIMVNHGFGFMILKVLFYFAAIVVPFLPKVDMYQLKNVFEYIYLPRGRGFPLLYVVFGIFVSILMSKATYWLKNMVISFFSKTKFGGNCGVSGN